MQDWQMRNVGGGVGSTSAGNDSAEGVTLPLDPVVGAALISPRDDSEDWRLGDGGLRDGAAALARTVRAGEAGLLTKLFCLVDREPGSMSAATRKVSTWLVCNSGYALAQARRMTLLAVSLAREPDVFASYARGEIGVDEARVVCGFVEAHAGDLTEANKAEAVRVLLKVARSRKRKDLRAAVEKLREALAGDVSPADDTDRNRLHLSRTLRGRYRLDGDLDAETGAMLRHALDQFNCPRPEHDGEPDRRPAGHRNADAVHEVLRRYFGGVGSASGHAGMGDDTAAGDGDRAQFGDSPGAGTERGRMSDPDDSDGSDDSDGTVGAADGGAPAEEGREARGGTVPGITAPARAAARSETPGRRPTEAARGDRHDSHDWARSGSATRLVVHVGLDDMVRAPLTDAQRRDLVESGRFDQYVADLTAGLFPGRRPMRWESLRRQACECVRTMVGVDAHSAPLNTSSSTRVATMSQRLALAARDGGCAFPHCDRPVGWTQAHHIQHWADGGPTIVDNMVLLCTEHHRAVHGKWRVAIGSDRLPAFRRPGEIDPHRRWVGPDGDEKSDDMGRGALYYDVSAPQ